MEISIFENKKPFRLVVVIWPMESITLDDKAEKRLFIFKMRTNFGHLYIWDQCWTHSARVEA